MQPKSMMDHALAYAARGWPVLPLHEVKSGKCSCGNDDCKLGGSAGKHPRTQHGVKDATTDASKIAHWWGAWPNANIGIALGKQAGVWVLDVDPRNGGDLSYELLLDKHGNLPDTVTSETGSKGRHYWWKYNGRAIPQRGNIYRGIDVKSDGGFIVAPPSKTAGDYGFLSDYDPFGGAEISDAPDWLVDDIVRGVRHVKHEPPAVLSITLSQEDQQEIRGALSMLALGNEVEDYDTWLRVGMALHSTQAQEAFALWCEWSGASPKFDIGTAKQKWLSFNAYRDAGVSLGTLWQMAEERGWKRPLPVVAIELIAPKLELNAQPAMPERLYNIPGVLGDFYHWCMNSAKKKQPQLAVAAAVQLGAAAMAQRYSFQGTRSTLLQIAVAPSSSGKEHPRECIKQVLLSAGLEDRLLGESFKSGSGLWRAVKSQPKGLCLLDEYGLYLSSVTSRMANPHRREVAESVMRIATGANTVVRGAEAADDRMNPRMDLAYPCLGLFGTTTMESLAPALTGAHVVDGFLNRHLMIVSEVGLAEPVPFDLLGGEMPGPPEHVVGQVAALSFHRFEECGYRDMVGVEPHSPIPVGIHGHHTPNALREFDLWCHERRKQMLGRGGIDALWGRAGEMARRVAMVIAGSTWKGQGAISVDLEAALWAIEYVRHGIATMEWMVGENVAESDYERVLNLCKRFIVAQGVQGATDRELTRAVRAFRGLTPRGRREVLDGLSMDGIKLVEIRVAGAGRGRVAYVPDWWVAKEGMREVRG